MKISKRKHCSFCDSEDHTVFYCPVKPKKSLNTMGLYYQRISKVRKEWFKLNPPDHAGYYFCALCGKAITRSQTELDHILSRSRHPELRYELSNLQPSCHECNSKKGSREQKAWFA